MADIDIVPKNRSRTWIWALLVVAVVLLILCLVMSSGSAPRTGVLEHFPAESALAVVFTTPPLSA